MFFDRPDAGTQALLVHIEADDSTAQELHELAVSGALLPVGEVTARQRVSNPKTYIGSGKLEEIAEVANAVEAELILFDQDLTPTQERNLEAALDRRVLGRTGLILHIFAQRARTHEGKLQVELAQLQHASTRLVRGWTHLDRQRGGSGRSQGGSMGVTGAGETQLEADQRMIGTRIKNINLRLDKVRKQRNQNRKARQRADIRTISLVGYTNAGKSTLFNTLCHSEVHAADQLFATLDPTLRQLELPVIGKAILTDTVGFIRQLPHGLVDAFRATLEEVCEADLLLHVVDAGSEERQAQMAQVGEVLAEIKAERVPQLLVYNKIDLIGEKPRIDRDGEGVPQRVWISGLHGEGLDLLLQAMAERCADQIVETTLALSPSCGQIRAKLFEAGAVLDEHFDDDGTQRLHIRIDADSLRKIVVRAGLALEDLGLSDYYKDPLDDLFPEVKQI